MNNNSIPHNELKDFLDEKLVQYNNPKFIDTDPISIPHRFTLKEDIEISAFLSATIAWGNRKMIIKSADKMMNLMGNTPYSFIMEHKEKHLSKLDGFVHRTFNADDFKYFIKSLKNIYSNYGGMEEIFATHSEKNSVINAIKEFRTIFFSINPPDKTLKHIGNPEKKSACKKINMFLRWMVRKDNCGVDFGLWKSIPASALSCPLDIHSGNVARKLGILSRKQNDLNAVKELDANLRLMDSKDPVKYDFALFGLGVFEKFCE